MDIAAQVWVEDGCWIVYPRLFKIVELIALMHPVDTSNAIVRIRKKQRSNTGFHYVERFEQNAGIQNVHKPLGPRRELAAIGQLYRTVVRVCRL